MTSNRSIAILLPDLRGGGAERVGVDLARSLAEIGCDVEFVLMDAAGDFLQEAQRDFSVFDLGVQRARSSWLPIARYLRRRRPAAFIANMWPLTGIAPAAAMLAGYRGEVLVVEHSILSKQYSSRGWAHGVALRVSTFLGYRLASARVGVSQGVCADMAALSRMPGSNFVSIHNPLRPLQAIDPRQLRLCNDLWGSGRKRILTVGSLKSVKNHQLLLKAFAALPRDYAQLMIVGQGEEEAKLRSLAQQLGIAEGVKFAGFQENPSGFYATADLFVLSSNHEGFGNVIVEALSFGLPVVSTDCPSGPAEILENGRWGRLVPVGDAGALARAMGEALEAPVDREALKRRAADFSPEIAARKYLEVLGLW